MPIYYPSNNPTIPQRTWTKCPPTGGIFTFWRANSPHAGHSSSSRATTPRAGGPIRGLIREFRWSPTGCKNRGEEVGRNAGLRIASTSIRSRNPNQRAISGRAVQVQSPEVKGQPQSWWGCRLSGERGRKCPLTRPPVASGPKPRAGRPSEFFPSDTGLRIVPADSSVNSGRRSLIDSADRSSIPTGENDMKGICCQVAYNH